MVADRAPDAQAVLRQWAEEDPSPLGRRQADGGRALGGVTPVRAGVAVTTCAGIRPGRCQELEVAERAREQAVTRQLDADTPQNTVRALRMEAGRSRTVTVTWDPRGRWLGRSARGGGGRLNGARGFG